MEHYSLYDPETGRITALVEDIQAPQEVHVVGRFDPATHMVISGEAVAIDPWQAQVTPNHIAGIPVGTEVRWGGRDDQAVIVDDGEVEFDLLEGETREVRATAPGYPSQIIKVSA